MSDESHIMIPIQPESQFSAPNVIKYCLICNVQPYLFTLSENKLHTEVESVFGENAIIAMEDIYVSDGTLIKCQFLIKLPGIDSSDVHI